MRTISFILFVLLTSLCFADPAAEKSPITKKERAEIQAHVEKETKQKIDTITRKVGDVIEVRTSEPSGPWGDRTGNTFILKRTKKGWIIQERTIWDACI